MKEIKRNRQIDRHKLAETRSNKERLKDAATEITEEGKEERKSETNIEIEHITPDAERERKWEERDRGRERERWCLYDKRYLLMVNKSERNTENQRDRERKCKKQTNRDINREIEDVKKGALSRNSAAHMPRNATQRLE